MELNLAPLESSAVRLTLHPEIGLWVPHLAIAQNILDLLSSHPTASSILYCLRRTVQEGVSPKRSQLEFSEAVCEVGEVPFQLLESGEARRILLSPAIKG